MFEAPLVHNKLKNVISTPVMEKPTWLPFQQRNTYIVEETSVCLPLTDGKNDQLYEVVLPESPLPCYGYFNDTRGSSRRPT